MAVSNLVPYTTGSDESSVQEVADGAVHTLVPVIRGRPGVVMVKIVDADDYYAPLANIGYSPVKSKKYQIQGPVSYVVQVKNAGCDVYT